MSNQSNETPIGKVSVDTFAELSKDDPEESLDLTKPIKEAKTKVDDTKLQDESETVEDEDEDEDGDEVDELADIEEDLKEIDEEKLELTTPVRRREILKKYPELFKDFPYLEKAYYREQQFTEILSTIDDAKEAAESHQVLKRYTEDMVEKGNVHNVLRMIKESSPETFANVVDNYMEHLEKVDPAAVLHVQSNLVKHLIAGMVEEARASKDDDLRTAALLLNKYAFGSSKWTPPQRMSKAQKTEDSEKESELTRKEQEFNERQIKNAVGEVNTRVNNAIKSAIENNIDPQGTMTDYIKKNATKDALDKISNLIEKDTRFQRIVEKLWEKSSKDDFSKESQDEIRRAFLSKAKSLLAPVLKSARNEALRGMGKKVKEADAEPGEQPERQKMGKERSLSSSNTQKAKLDSLKGKSSYEALQALMGD